LVVAGLLYSLGLSASGWANSYYSAAGQAGALSWRAMLFGGLDPSGGITVDKPPGALWLADLSVRCSACPRSPCFFRRRPARSCRSLSSTGRSGGRR
jgi:hypothetical protein